MHGMMVGMVGMEMSRGRRGGLREGIGRLQLGEESGGNSGNPTHAAVVYK